MRQRSHVLGVLAIAALVLAACGTPTPPAADGSEIVVAFPSDVDTIDPHQFKSIAAYGVVGNIYASLLQERYAEPVDGVLEFTGESAPYLAESATWNADRTVLTFVLRTGVTFADGSPMLAEDVVYSLQRALSDVGYSSAIGAWLNLADPAGSIVARDDRTVELRVTHYSPLIERFLTFQIFPVLDRSKLAAEAPADDPWAARYLAATATASGPYVIESRVQGQSVTLSRNRAFTAADLTGAPDRVVVQNMPDPQQSFLALQNGAVDIVAGLTPDIADAVAADPRLKLYELAYSDIVYLGMNNADPALSDVRVRRAISHLMPYDTLRKDVMKGYAAAAYGAVPAPMTDALDPSGEQVAYPTDVAAARKLLAEAGIADGRLALTLSVPASEPTLRQSAVFLQSAMQQAGIRVTIDELSEADFNSNLGKLQMYVDSWFSWGQDSVYQLYFLLTTGKFTNYTNFSDPRVDDLVARAMATSDVAERTRLSQEAQRIVVEQAPWAFLFTRDILIGAQADVTGITHSDDANLRFDRIRKGTPRS